jgi:hypothetical protein
MQKALRPLSYTLIRTHYICVLSLSPSLSPFLSLSLPLSCRYGTELRGNFQAPHPCFVVGAVGGAGRNAGCYGTPRQEDTAAVDRQGHTAYRSEHAHAADGPKYGGGHFWVTNPFLRPGYLL